MSETLPLRPSWLDRIVGAVSPERALRRMRARVATELVARHYEAVSTGRRTQGWRRPVGDANAVTGPALARLRASARDLVRNNGHAKKALDKIQDHVVGWGIVAKPNPANARALDTWRRWSETTQCDSDGRLDFYGIQKLVMRTVAEAGECLVRRRYRRPEDGLDIPMQLQVLEPDFLDTDLSRVERNADGIIVRRIIHGVEFDALGRRAAYWLLPEHPGAADAFGIGFGAGASRRIPAESVLHVFRQERPGQVRGPSWFAPVLLKFKDFDEYSDATLMKQKIAACLAVITTDVDGSGAPIGTETGSSGQIDLLEPGAILNVPAGRNIEVVQPPTVREHADFSRATLREIAAGLGLSYEELAGDWSAVNFSSARMSRISHWARVDDWRWSMLIPQLCSPVWAWAMEAAAIMGLATADGVRWTPPPMQMIEPDKEGLAHMRNIRAGLTTLFDVQRELGYDPAELLEEYAEVNAKLDELGIVLDSDPRKTTQQGLPTETQKPGGGGGGEGDGGGDAPDDAEAVGKAAADAADEEADRAHRERLAMIEALRAASGRKVEVQVDARTTVEPGAIKVEAPTTIARGAVQVETKFADGAVRSHVQLPLTITDEVHVPAGRRTVERDEQGRIAAVVSEGEPQRVLVTRDPKSRRMTGAEEESSGQ